MVNLFIGLILGLIREAHLRPRTILMAIIAVLAAWYIHAYRLEQALYYEKITYSISLSTQLASYTASNDKVVQELTNKLATHAEVLTGTQVKLTECERRMAVVEQDSKHNLILCGADHGR